MSENKEEKAKRVFLKTWNDPYHKGEMLTLWITPGMTSLDITYLARLKAFNLYRSSTGQLIDYNIDLYNLVEEGEVLELGVV